MNIGCGAGEKCGVVVQTANPSLTTTTECVQDGTAQLGLACAFDGTVSDGMTGISDCVGGTECRQGVCTTVCDGNAMNPCVGSEVCGVEVGFYSGTSFGLCTNSCDPVGVVSGARSTGCIGPEACYADIFALTAICGQAFCDVENPCTHDSSCQFINACHPGKSCAVLNVAQDGLLCAKLCIPPAIAMGLTADMLPLDSNVYPPSSLNGQAPWGCSRLNDGAGQPDDALLAPNFVCIPLGGDDAVRYWGDLAAADGWPYASKVGVCIDTSAPGGNPYYVTMAAARRPMFGSDTKLGAQKLLQSLRGNLDYRAIAEAVKTHR